MSSVPERSGKKRDEKDSLDLAMSGHYFISEVNFSGVRTTKAK
jgi:hypothetical protein